MRQDIPTSPAPGIYQLRLPLTGSPLKHINSYLIPGEKGHLLIDTGWNADDALEALENQFHALGFGLDEIRTIVITHSHLDHFGLIKRLRRRCQAALFMHRVEARLVDLRFDDLTLHARETEEVLRRGGMEDAMLPGWEETIRRFSTLARFEHPDFTFSGGEVIRHGDFELQVVWTPGHSPGHICLWEPNRRLFFAGDHVLGDISPNIGIYPHSGSNPLGDYLESLDKVKDLPAELVLPSHGRPFRGLAKRVEELASHHGERNRELLENLRRAGEPLSPCQLAEAITWHSKGKAVSWRELPGFDMRLAVFEVMAHLEAMAVDGRLSRQNGGQAIKYQLA